MAASRGPRRGRRASRRTAHRSALLAGALPWLLPAAAAAELPKTSEELVATLRSAITFEDGRVQQSNFHDYDVARIDSAPLVVYTHIVEHPFDVHATGVGEPGVPPFAPALYNAIFNATGKRIRALPLGDQLRA